MAVVAEEVLAEFLSAAGPRMRTLGMGSHGVVLQEWDGEHPRLRNAKTLVRCRDPTVMAGSDGVSSVVAASPGCR
ncbi:Uncharacterised protein [Mycobacteroides abscessus subsp. abscessus]|nr:Uncharacterised protein [Mycobacteroides abscessus subsp. abscessus]